jgi:hypothetical protein
MTPGGEPAIAVHQDTPDHPLGQPPRHHAGLAKKEELLLPVQGLLSGGGLSCERSPAEPRQHQGKRVFWHFLRRKVMSKDDRFYTHPSKIYRFHHTSLVSGEPVKAAGEWYVEHGDLKWLSGASGPYHTTAAGLQEAIRVPTEYGVPAWSYKIKVLRQVDREWQADFIKASTYLAMGADDLAKYAIG